MAATEQLARTPTPAPHHGLPVPDVVVLLGTDRERGLSEHEAADRLTRLGPNVLPRLGQRGPWLRLLLQFHHPLIHVLLVAAGATQQWQRAPADGHVRVGPNEPLHEPS
ncbi:MULTISPECIES: cation-transporting P-type ATPase [unclassified Modestobacter]